MPENIYFNLLPFNIEGTTLIPLSQGYWSLVDTEIALIAPRCHAWISDTSKSYYARFSYKTDTGQRTKLLHRFVLEHYAIDAPNDIDHINYNGLDNRLCNLRAATRLENQGNQGLRSNNTSGHRGAYWYPRYSKWISQISINGKRKHLGYFENIIDAAKAYDRAAIEHFGIEFAYTNFSKENYLKG